MEKAISEGQARLDAARTTIEDFNICVGSPEELREKCAGLVLSPSVTSAVVVQKYNANSGLDINVLEKQVKELQAGLRGGSLEVVESMLLGQALALQSLFTDLACRAKSQTGLDQLQCLTSLALRAQNGCRSTLQTLAEVKFPRQAVFAKQANIANGPQQVNNGAAAPAPAKDVTPSNELLELPDARMDTGTQGEAGGADTWLATVEAINRAKVRTGQGDSGPKQPEARRAVRAGN